MAASSGRPRYGPLLKDPCRSPFLGDTGPCLGAFIEGWRLRAALPLPAAGPGRMIRPRPREKDTRCRFPEGPEGPVLSNAKGCGAETTPGVSFAGAT